MSLVFSLFFATPAFAAGLSSTDRSVVAMGSGGTGAARADDPGANVYNPAAGVTVPGLTLGVGTLIAAPRLNADGGAWRSSTAGGASVPPHVHARWSNETFGFGASLTVPFGSEVRWPDDWARRFDLIAAQVRVLRLSGFGAYKIGDLSFAAGPFVDFGTLELQRAIDFIEAEGKTQIDTHARGFGVLAAVYWRANAELALGVSYQSRSRLNLEGYADFSVPPELRGRAGDGAVSAKMTMPDRLTLGASYHVADNFDLYADLELLVWSTMDELRLDFAQENMDDVTQRRDWRATVSPRIGASYLANDWLTLRGGLFLDPSPVPVETLNPSSPDSTRVGLALGAGAEVVRGLGVDLGYQLLIFTGATSEAEGLQGVSFGGTAHLVGLSLRYRLH